MHSTALRLAVVFMLISIGAFFTAGWTDGGTVPVAVGFLGLFAATGAFAAFIDSEPGPARPAERRWRAPRSSPHAVWEIRP